MIDLLSNRPRFAERIVDALWEEWGDDYAELTEHKTRGDLLRFYEKVCRGAGDAIPVAYVSFDDDEYVASLLVDVEDMGARPDLSPWLANVYTAPEHRNRGRASELIRHAVELHPTLHLWTFGDGLADFYERFGFGRIGVLEKHGKYRDAIVMKRDHCATGR